jgi:hypothetical protein
MRNRVASPKCHLSEKVQSVVATTAQTETPPLSMFDRIARTTSFFNPTGLVRYHLLPFRSSKYAFDGLISFLTKVAQGNPHDKGLITAIGDTPFDTSIPYEARNAVDLDTISFFHSRNAKDQSLCYDFKDMSVVLTHYTLKSHDYPVNGDHLKSWVIEVSGDNNQWTVVDYQKNNGRLNGPCAVADFEIECPVEARYVRIRQMDLNWHRTLYMVIRAFEVFGALRVPVATG